MLTFLLEDKYRSFNRTAISTIEFESLTLLPTASGHVLSIDRWKGVARDAGRSVCASVVRFRNLRVISRLASTKSLKGQNFDF